MTRPLLTFVIITQLEILLLFIAVIVLAAQVDAASRSAATDIPATANGPSMAAAERESEPSPLSGALLVRPETGPREASGTSEDVTRTGPRGVPSPSATTRIPEPSPVARRPVSTRSSMKGLASWYAADGLIAAVHSWHWGNRPYYVRVCALRCIRVLVQDACAGCTGSRLIDLSDDAFRLLAPLSQGIIRVEVTQW